jgi:outer membrane receptor protein involved in Fe transport
LISLLLSAPSAMRAQGAGELRLQVNDPSGAGVAADGTLKSGSAPLRSFQTDDQGAYAATGLAAGRYAVEISKSGFANQTLNVNVTAGAPVSRTITLAIVAEKSSLDVVSVAPLPGTTMSKDDVPMNVQTANAQDLERTGAIALSDFMNRKLGGVFINNNQENPFQPDLNYRGYTASPLLGTPQGMSVYVDGVRQNQPFGDVVAWDLIPQNAIQEMALVPGSDPIFGLNTLGAAVAVTTKDGRSAPGTSLSVNGGSWGRRSGEFEHGGSMGAWNLFTSGNWFREDGWRPYSPSQVRQIFAKAGYTHGNTSISLGFSYADNNLTGNGSSDTRFLAADYSTLNTIPDITWNRSPAFTLNARHTIGSNLEISGAAYFRYVRADTTNGDLNDDSFTESLYNLSADDQAALLAAGYTNFPVTGNATTEPFPFWRCIAQGLQQDEPSEKCTGVFTNTWNQQHAWGGSVQESWFTSHNRLAFGVALDRASLTYKQFSRFGYMNTDGLSITPIDSYEDGSTEGDGEPVDTRVNLHGLTNSAGVYVTDTVRLMSKLAVTLSGRYNHAQVHNFDRLGPSTDPESRGSLDGNHNFNRFNPAAGVVYTPLRQASVYFSYSEANRAPTAIELGCADPNQPCNLPNALVADPPLKQVVAKTFEAGIRSTTESRIQWNAGWFRTENKDDLLFIASEQTGFGYFLNVDQTLRQGAEFGLSGRYKWFTLGGNYTFLDATFQSTETLGGASNSANDADNPGEEGNITVVPGDQLPLVPRNLFKAYLEMHPTDRLSVDLDFNAAGRSFVRGNENNRHQPDGVYYLGPGFTPGYGVTNLGAQYRLQKHLSFSVEFENLFNHRYYTSGQLNTTPFDANRNFIPRPFASNTDAVRNTTYYSPGAPRGVFGGMKITF